MIKKKKCRHCKEPFSPFSSTQVACSPMCALAIGKKVTAKKAKADAKQSRAKLKARKDKLKSRSDWLREAQKEFNRFIRLRDKIACISCDRPLTAKYDAGHYRSVGAFPELRFCEDNVHGQCVHCNQHKSGNPIDYRIGLVKKIGIERVERLEGKHDAKKYTIDQVKDIKAMYKKKANDLK